MTYTFDPLHKWLGIPPAEQPPNYYRLLGLSKFEADPDVISNAADQRMGYLRSFQSGEHADDAARLLNAVEAARRVLLSAAKIANQPIQEMRVAPPPTDRLDTIIAEVVKEANSRPLPRTRPSVIPKPPPPEEYHYEPQAPVLAAEPPAALEYTPRDAFVGWLLVAIFALMFAIQAAI